MTRRTWGSAWVVLLLASLGLALYSFARNWGIPPLGRAVNRIVIHHTAGDERDVQQIREAHLRRGFKDIAYHYVIQPNGRIETGRTVSKLGAGVWGRHGGMVEIVLIGKLHVNKPSRVQWESAAQLAAKWCLKHRLTTEQVVGHCEAAAPGHATLCPGFKMDDFRTQVRREMEKLK